MIANQLFYRVLNERTIIVAADNTQKRTQYEEQVIRTFFISHADATELTQLLTGADARRRHGDPAADRRQQDHQHAHRPRHRAGGADRRARHRGQRQAARRSDGRRADSRGQPRARQALRPRSRQLLGGAGVLAGSRRRATTAKPFNLNTISQGISTADFYLSVPTAVVRFLESDSQTKVLAKPNLRGTEGQKLSLNLGEDVPMPSTTFTPLAGGGVGRQPADLVRLSHHRHHRRDDAARDLRRRHHPRAHAREQRARPGREHRRAEPAVVLLAQGARPSCGCATANRTCWPACCAKTSAGR